MIGVGLVGFGYWGPNLARNFSQIADCRLTSICDTSLERQKRAAQLYPGLRISGDFRTILEDNDIHLVLIATPVATHYGLAQAALEAGKDVMVEKPFTQYAHQAKALVSLAESKGRIIAVDHTFLFTGAVQKIKSLVDQGELGNLLYFDSVRINLGLFQHDVNVIYDLAPHDLAILSHLVGQPPISVQTNAVANTGNGIENIAYLFMEYPHGLVAHCHLNWLSPVKIRQVLLAGDKKMVVFDDNAPDEKVKIYDKGVGISAASPDEKYRQVVNYRVGDMTAPQLARTEALALEAEQIIACVKNRTPPLSDGRFGWLVVRILDAAQRSLLEGGRRVLLTEIP